MEKIIEDRVEFLDERFYVVGDKYYPSVTTILENYPKGPQFLQWIKDVGNQARVIAERAAESGSKVHNAIEMLLSGAELVWDDKVYNEMEWLGVNRFMDFHTRFKPIPIGVEVNVFSKKHGYAGTADLPCEIDGEVWMIDHKFGNAIYSSYWLQIAAYKQAWEEQGNKKIDRMGILHLKAKTRGPRDGKMQGKGWQMVEPPKSFEHHWEVFLAVKKIWDEEHPDAKPRNRIYPSKLKI